MTLNGRAFMRIFEERMRTLGISVVGNAEFRIHRRLLDNKSKGIGDSDVGN